MNKFNLSICLAISATLFLTACAVETGSDELLLESAWVRPIPPGMKMTAGFGTLKNASDSSVVLTAFSSPVFGDVSLHRTEQVDGVSRMREVAELVIDPGAAVLLEPGGYHLMLMMPESDIAVGENVPVEMTSADGRSFRFELPVERH